MESLKLGVLFSVLGTALGVAAWVVASYFTQRFLFFFPIGLGSLAGLGMMIGYGEEEDVPGFIAAGIAAVGVFAAIAIIAGFSLAETQADVSMGELTLSILRNPIAGVCFLIAVFLGYVIPRHGWFWDD